MGYNLIGKIMIGKRYRIEDRKPVKNVNDWASTKIIYGGAVYPITHSGHIVEILEYWPPAGPTGFSYAGDAKVKCITCGEVLERTVSDQFLEEGE